MLYSASQRRLLRDPLSVTSRRKERSSNYVETQVVSALASHSGVQEECHSKVQEPLRFWDREVRDRGTRRSQRSAVRRGRDEQADSGYESNDSFVTALFKL